MYSITAVVEKQFSWNIVEVTLDNLVDHEFGDENRHLLRFSLVRYRQSFLTPAAIRHLALLLELSQMLNIRLGRKVHSRCPHV